MALEFRIFLFIANSISTKLRIKPKMTLLTLNSPANFKNGLEGLPAGVKIADNTKIYDQFHWFVGSKAQMEKEVSKLMKLLNPGITIGVYYPSDSLGLQISNPGIDSCIPLPNHDFKTAPLKKTSLSDKSFSFLDSCTCLG